MFCIISFVILCLSMIPVMIVSIWISKLPKSYFKWLKKAWECVVRKFTLQKCEITFKDEVKNSILRKILFKKPELVKPISLGIDILVVVLAVVVVLLIYLMIRKLGN